MSSSIAVSVEIDQNSDERKRHCVDIPFPDGQGSDFLPSRTMGHKFDLVAAGREFLHSFGGHEIDETEIRDYSFEVSSHLLLWMGKMNGKIDVECSQ